MECPKCSLENPEAVLKCECGYQFAFAKTSEPGKSQPIQVNREEPEPWSNAIISGIVSAVIAGLSAGFGGGKLGFGAWMVCYILFLH